MDGSSCCNRLPAIRSVHKDALQYTARLLSAHYVTILFRSGQKTLPQIALERVTAHHKLQKVNCKKFMDSIYKYLPAMADKMTGDSNPIIMFIKFRPLGK